MADLKTWAQTAQDFIRDNVLGPTNNGNFFQTRTTRTPGMVTDMDPSQRASYTPGESASEVVHNSSMESALRDALAKEWADQTGFIRVQPWAARDNTTLRHEQMHAITDKGGLSDQIGKLIPMVSAPTLQKIGASPTYAAEGNDIGHERMMGEEGVAYDVAEGVASKKLRNAIAQMLAAHKDQKKQFRSLTK